MAAAARAATKAPIIIVGAGQTGTRAALTLRELGWSGQIVLIGAEREDPYERPTLSKQYLAGSHAAPTIATAAALESQGIDVRLGTTVASIDRTAAAVSFAGGDSLHYGTLLLTTGRRARTLPPALIDGRTPLTLRTSTDADQLRQALTCGGSLLVVGGGLIGLEVAASARSLGVPVTVVESEARLLQRVVPVAISKIVRDRHEAAGVTVRLSTHVAHIHGNHSGFTVFLNDGNKNNYAAVLIAIGAEPNMDIARKSGLMTGRAIKVDTHLRTSDPLIFAAGDVAEVCADLASDGSVIETWKNADEQGRFVAQSMLGAENSWSAVPWFWSDQHDLSIQGSGTHQSADSHVLRTGENGDLIVFSLGADGLLEGVHGVGGNRIGRDVSIGQMLIERRVRCDPATLADRSTPLRSLLKAAA